MLLPPPLSPFLGPYRGGTGLSMLPRCVKATPGRCAGWGRDLRAPKAPHAYAAHADHTERHEDRGHPRSAAPDRSPSPVGVRIVIVGHGVEILGDRGAAVWQPSSMRRGNSTSPSRIEAQR